MGFHPLFREAIQSRPVGVSDVKSYVGIVACGTFVANGSRELSSQDQMTNSLALSWRQKSPRPCGLRMTLTLLLASVNHWMSAVPATRSTRLIRASIERKTLPTTCQVRYTLLLRAVFPLTAIAG